MSRVDEAFKRVASGALNIAEPTAPGNPPRPDNVFDGDPSALYRYPQESPAAAAAVAPAVAGTAAADSRFDRFEMPHFSPAYRSRLVVERDTPPETTEQYRRLAAAMHRLQAEQSLRRLMVSSAVPGEGKTLTVVNLAMTLSEFYERRVLLIDADLRRPSVHDVFGISNTSGLCDALRAERTEPQFSRVSPKLWVLPAGTPDSDPMAVLASKQMEQFVVELEASFDWILLDAPPLGLMADATLLARLTRAVVVVVAAGSTPYALVERAIADIGREHIVGTVLNRATQKTAAWSSYYPAHDLRADSRR
jgi:capsular exopolysaccharide synthesis family protein